MAISTLSELIFRLAQDEDLPAIIDIWQENMINEMPTEQMMRSCTNILTSLFNDRQDYFNYWVAIDEQTMSVVGWQSYFPVFTTPLKKGTVVESSTYIRRDYQGRRVAFRLMSFALDCLKESDLHFVYGYIKETNIGVQKIVEKLGFVKVGLIPNIDIFPHNYLKLLFIYQIPKCDKTLMSSNGGGGVILLCV